MSPRNNAVCKCFASFTCGNAFCSIIPHATGRTAYYTAPIKALVSEKFFDMVDILGRENVGMITGDSTINTEAPVICCTAEILANQALREGPASKVGCVVMDEFHFYADPDRGWAQERKARDAAMAAMKADGVEYEERLERLAEVTYPKPLEELLDRDFELYCQGVPWARDYFAEHNEIRLDGDARSVAYLSIDESPEAEQHLWHVRQIFLDEISYIKNARYMLTDSFHGTAFAINFHTPFLEVLPNNKTGARNQSILQLTGLEDRIVTDFNDFSLADRQIDYAKVNEIMHRERERSMEKLAELCECQM